MSELLLKLSSTKLVIQVIAVFFLLNSLWVLLDKQATIIGDDARFLTGAYQLAGPLKRGDLPEFYNTWQNLFVKNTNSFPRTPLFSVLAVPAFLVFGVNEDAAIISNLFIIALSSYLIFLLAKKFFPEENQKLLPLAAVLVFNLLPGVYGLGRLYMSETLQTFFVLLLTLLLFNYAREKSLRHYALLGLISSLAMLLRFIMPVYLVVPAGYFLFKQLQLKEKAGYYLKAAAVFLLCFLPLTLTWYGQNFSTYLKFANYTTSGELAKYTSLGPVFSPVTVLKFWYVIAVWYFSWPFVLLAVTALAVVLAAEKKMFFKNICFSRKYLWLIPIPALVAATISDNKTARYFQPVIAFWVILLGSYLTLWLQDKRLFLKILFGFVSLLLVYPYVQSLAVFLPRLPRTGLNYAAAAYDRSLKTAERYNFFYQFYRDVPKPETGKLKIYNTAEQTRFNDAQLIWYGLQQGVEIDSIGEFAKYSTIAEGEAKAAQADVLIVETNPEASSMWQEKFLQFRDYVLSLKDFVIVKRLSLPADNSELLILTKI